MGLFSISNLAPVRVIIKVAVITNNLPPRWVILYLGLFSTSRLSTMGVIIQVEVAIKNLLPVEVIPQLGLLSLIHLSITLNLRLGNRHPRQASVKGGYRDRGDPTLRVDRNTQEVVDAAEAQLLASMVIRL